MSGLLSKDKEIKTLCCCPPDKSLNCLSSKFSIFKLSETWFLRLHPQHSKSKSSLTLAGKFVSWLNFWGI